MSNASRRRKASANIMMVAPGELNLTLTILVFVKRKWFSINLFYNSFYAFSYFIIWGLRI